MKKIEGYTKGPWRACRSGEDFSGPFYPLDDDEKAEFEAKPLTSIEAADGTTVFNAHDLFTFKNNADAELIAAAPETYERCVKLEDLLARIIGTCGTEASKFSGGHVSAMRYELYVEAKKLLEDKS